ncbi:nuclear transport factor 2 family protein [Jannaschia sp. W003]|uniref:YybH family protein n=1 Tax=Jannaschia sp. W003 TaxID=2867012 RepID=UPI0021A292A0|nr:nuclear transport factor 2 family protein [Jannaschia sp. W003]UWQ20110.1 nuclear transport factor 2 family protein [Jannaschia sp. W003]
MTRFALAAAAAFMLLPPVPAAADAHVDPAVQAVIDAFDIAIRGDDTALAPVFAEDGVMMPASGGRFEGHAEIAAWLAEFPDMTAFDVEVDEVMTLGDGFETVIGTYTVTLPEEMGGATLPGEYVSIGRREGDAMRVVRHVAFPPRMTMGQ